MAKYGFWSPRAGQTASDCRSPSFWCLGSQVWSGTSPDEASRRAEKLTQAIFWTCARAAAGPASVLLWSNFASQPPSGWSRSQLSSFVSRDAEADRGRKQGRCLRGSERNQLVAIELEGVTDGRSPRHIPPRSGGAASAWNRERLLL